MLAAILFMISVAGTSSIPELMRYHFAPGTQTWLWLAFFASFAVKMPMWPVHTWLPDAHVEAPTAGSVILAGILLKMGGYGFLRFSLPMFPAASVQFTPLIFTLSVIAIVYTSLVAFRQTDIKKLIAYSSVAHMGFVTMGIFSGNIQGEQGAIFQMLSHGVISGALFLCVGVVYDRMHTREIAFYGGLVNRMPWYAAVFMLFTMGNVGLPGTSGFVGEILTMTGAYSASTWTVIVAATGVILSAVYMLTVYRRVVFGEITNTALATISDLNRREVLIFAPLIVGTLVLGLAPGMVFEVTNSATQALVGAYHAAAGADDGPEPRRHAGPAGADPRRRFAGAAGLGRLRQEDWSGLHSGRHVGAGRRRLRRRDRAGRPAFGGALIADDGAGFAKVAIYGASAVAILCATAGSPRKAPRASS